ncbi:hypothetical protein RJ641_006617 [Dillenia turbinata]|uniref:WIT1/2 N-terminal helical bundle domain-containing protein n=1 Tax=Dillenia turbinata TaxID=194707 RepID=A0AAN8VDM8_9MAGN
MDVDQRETIPVEDANVRIPEVDSNSVDLLEGNSDGGDSMTEGCGDLLRRVELDLACSSEKLTNLNVLMMHVATKENDLEAYEAENEVASADFEDKAMECDLLSEIFDSEVRELEKFLAVLQVDIVNAHGIIYASYDLYLKEKLHYFEELLKQSEEQVLEMKTQSAEFQRTLLRLGGDNGGHIKDADNVENGQIFKEEKINMQTVAQQRSILRMLEKSLARELDLEKKLTESRKIEEELKQRLHSSDHEIFCLEEEEEHIVEKLFEADNAAKVLLGISKELIGRLQVLQFNLNGLNQRELDLKSKLKHAVDQLEAKESALQALENSKAELNELFLSQSDKLKATLKEAEDKLALSESEAFTLREKVSALEKQLKDTELELLNAKVTVGSGQEHHDVNQEEMEKVVVDLKDKIMQAESGVEVAEAKYKSLMEANTELNKELAHLKSSGITIEKVTLLEKQLRESDIQLQHAVASAEASQEKQSMLFSIISDMESLIEDLKAKVAKAESHVDAAEQKCIMLLEANADLNEELGFQKARMASLEASLHQAENTKLATAKDIGIRTKVIASLVMQLAFERERLQKEVFVYDSTSNSFFETIVMSSLMKENKVLVVKSQHTNKEPSVTSVPSFEGTKKERMFSMHDLSTPVSAKEGEGITELSATGYELEKTLKDVTLEHTEVTPSDSESTIQDVRTIDAGQLNCKYLIVTILVVLVSIVAAYIFQQDIRPF